MCAPTFCFEGDGDGNERARKQFFFEKRTKKLLFLCALLITTRSEAAEQLHGFLEHIHRHSTLTSTVPDNGDVNPYAIVVAPVSAGTVQKDDVLVDNFNNISNLQGTGTTIIGYRPSTRATYLFAKYRRTCRNARAASASPPP